MARFPPGRYLSLVRNSPDASTKLTCQVQCAHQLCRAEWRSLVETLPWDGDQPRRTMALIPSCFLPSPSLPHLHHLHHRTALRQIINYTNRKALSRPGHLRQSLSVSVLDMVHPINSLAPRLPEILCYFLKPTSTVAHLLEWPRLGYFPIVNGSQLSK